MADRIEREIEEILARLDDLPAEGQPERKPISILDKREQQRRPVQPAPPGQPQAGLRQRLTPTALLLGGAATVVGGLVLSNVWGPLIWASFAGVVVFLLGFVAAFFQRPRPAAAPKGVYWRDRYIEYRPRDSGGGSRLSRFFRRRR
jgi:Flp pilus assembly protein TadB